MLRTRLWTFRALSVLLGLSLFIMLEFVCRLSGWGAESQATGDFAEFAGVRALFSLNASTGEYAVADNRRLYFSDESFPVAKADNEFRIFVFGGSTVQGRPFSIPTSFTTFLEMCLQKASPQTKWQVINCGGISYASYRLLPIMRECLDYQPDLYIVCTGHNEFLEFMTYAQSRQQTLLTNSYSFLSRFNSFHVAQNLLSPRDSAEQTRPKIKLAEEVDAVLDHQGGLEAYTREALQTSRIVDSFESNLQQMANLSAETDVPLLMIQPPANLIDCPPFKSEFRRETSETSRQDISARLTQASDLLKTDASAAISLLETVVRDDPEFALGWYQLGRALAHNYRPDEAIAALQRACDEDICPLRMISKLQQAMVRVVATNELPFLDAQDLLAGSSRNGLVGESTLVDHIHPSFRSHQEIAIAIVGLMQSEELVSIDNEFWVSEVRTELEQYIQSLDDMYFLRGRQTLQLLQIWTDGRADGPPLSDTQSTAVEPVQ